MTRRAKLVWFLLTAVVLAAFGGFYVWVGSKPPGFDSPPPVAVSNRLAAAAKLAQFLAEEEKIDHTVWAKEMLAQQCGKTVEALWDSLNAASNKLDAAAEFPLGRIRLGLRTDPLVLPHGIQFLEPVGPGPTISQDDWRGFVKEAQAAGWESVESEFRHIRFDTDDAGRPKRSVFYCRADLNNERLHRRATLEGDLVIGWDGGLAKIAEVDASGLTIKLRNGSPPFRLILSDTIAPQKKTDYIDPLILHDLDGDGLPEILLVAANKIYKRDAAGSYRVSALCRFPLDIVLAAIVGDFDGDGFADLLCANNDGLFLFQGSKTGEFDAAPRQVWKAIPRWVNPMALTCGDVDGDGDLDVFMGQYKVPTIGQIIRPHFYDSSDGRPSSLLINNGKGEFSDATIEAGLGKNRNRRVYSASFADLDGDGELDLSVVSDFAGVDLYRGDGHGHFTEVTSNWIAEPHALGMGQVEADFNADGRLDFLMIGMNSPSADRLDHLGLGRPEAPKDGEMRSKMTYGNRLYLARPGGGFAQTALSDSVARSGWSWGCAAFDFDNDGFPDVYIANGHQSKQWVRDYDPEFWLHDLYVDAAVDDATATSYFLGKHARTRGQGWSYGGYETKRLYWNDHGKRFNDIGYLMGVADQRDARNTAADDLDGDGRVDLLVTTYEVWPEVRQTLQVYHNELNGGGHWIGFKFRETPGGISPVGASVSVHSKEREAVREIVAGDSHRTQLANVIHFGLGENSHITRAEIHWPGGVSVTLENPAVDEYHWIPAPLRRPAANSGQQ